MIKYIELNQLSSINMYIWWKLCFFVNHKLNYQFNMNVDQSTRAIPVICTCKNVIWIFLDPAHEMPTLIFVLYFTMIEVGKMNLFWIGGYIFCKCGVNGHHIKKVYIKKLCSCNQLIVGLMNSVL